MMFNLSPSDSVLKKYVKYFAAKQRDFKDFKENSLCSVCQLIDKMRPLLGSRDFLSWLKLFSYKMALTPFLTRFTVLYAALLLKKCKQLVKDDSHIPWNRTTKEKIMDMISPVSFWFHFCVKQCHIHTAIYTKNLDRMALVNHVGQIAEIIDRVSERFSSEEENSVSIFTSNDHPESFDGNVEKRSANNPLSLAGNIDNRFVKNLVGEVTRIKQLKTRAHVCFDEKTLNEYKRMYESLEEHRVAQSLSETEINDFVRLFDEQYSQFSMVYDGRRSVQRILDTQAVEDFNCLFSKTRFSEENSRTTIQRAAFDESVETDFPEQNSATSILCAGLDECILCNFNHFSCAYEYLENDFWYSVNVRRPDFGKINLPIYNEFIERKEKEKKTKLEEILFNRQTVDNFYRHFVASPTCRNNRIRSQYLHSGSAPLKCLASFAEVLLYKLVQKLQSDATVNTASKEVKHLVQLLKNHGLLHSEELLWTYDGL